MKMFVIIKGTVLEAVMAANRHKLILEITCLRDEETYGHVYVPDEVILTRWFIEDCTNPDKEPMQAGALLFWAPVYREVN